MGQISDIRNPWRQQLLSAPASFRNVMFFVESGSRASGRRTVLHEYPKRPDEMGPYAEDMGKHAIRFQISGYLIYRVRPVNGMAQYTIQRNRLITALEQPDKGIFVHPVLYPRGIDVMVERYNMTETRERGGYTQFEMSFVQAGVPGNSNQSVDAKSKVDMSAKSAEKAGSDLLNNMPTDL